jgi:hypothetical protein
MLLKTANSCNIQIWREFLLLLLMSKPNKHSLVFTVIFLIELGMKRFDDRVQSSQEPIIEEILLISEYGCLLG